MGHKVFLTALASLLALSMGCTTGGEFGAMNLTNVELTAKNFQIVATNVFGEAESAHLLGFSGGTGSRFGTIALIRVDGTGLLYKEAVEILWNNFEREHGSPEGRHLALVNVRYDSDSLNLLLYTKAKLSIRADVVEFTE